MAVKWNVVFFDWTSFDTTADYLHADWSTNGTNWTAFVTEQGSELNGYTSHGRVTALADSDYAGGTDLYLRFTMYRAVGGLIDAQLFRCEAADPAPFIVSGTVSASTIPEPSTAILLGSGVLGLLAYAWRKKR